MAFVDLADIYLLKSGGIIDGSLTVNGTLTSSGAATFANNVIIGGNLTTSGVLTADTVSFGILFKTTKVTNSTGMYWGSKDTSQGNAATTQKTITMQHTCSGYYPLGVADYYNANNYASSVTSVYLSSQSTGSATVSMTLRPFSSTNAQISSSTFSRVLWVRSDIGVG